LVADQQLPAVNGDFDPLACDRLKIRSIRELEAFGLRALDDGLRQRVLRVLLGRCGEAQQFISGGVACWNDIG
jgi:hypothetical protein